MKSPDDLRFRGRTVSGGGSRMRGAPDPERS
jgi:hypothetical protein